MKLKPPPGAKVDTIIINGAECEPYLTADDCLMRNHPVQLLEGLRALMYYTGYCIDRERAATDEEEKKRFGGAESLRKIISGETPENP